MNAELDSTGPWFLWVVLASPLSGVAVEMALREWKGVLPMGHSTRPYARSGKFPSLPEEDTEAAV